MKNRLLSTILVLALLMTLLPGLGVSVSAEDEDYIWPEMLEGIAMRYTVSKTESTRIMVGDTFHVEFWINNIAPYSMVIPLRWDPNVVEMIDEATGEPVTSGRKTESDVGIGFRPGASCYDPSYDEYYRPKYWNGKMIFSDVNTDPELGFNTDEGYPYIDNEHGYCTFLYYVDAATPSVAPQMFLELTFKALKRGEPNFHFATDWDRYSDPAAPDGLTMGFTSEGVISPDLEMPGVFVIASSSEETIVPPNPGVQQPNRDPGTGTGSGTGTVIKPDTGPKIQLLQTQHLTYYPYSTPIYTSAVIRKEAGKNVRQSDNYLLPESSLAEAINRLVNSNSSAIVARMPNERIDKSDYTISFSCANLDDLVNRMSAMLYFETPHGFVGVNPAALLAQLDSDQTEVTLRVNRTQDGVSLGVRVDGASVDGFKAPVFLLILPYSGEAEPLVVSNQVFGDGYTNLEGQPLTISRWNAEKQTVSFFTPAAGSYTVLARTEKSFEDLPDTHWATSAVTELTGAGVIKGRSETKFVPDGEVTRAEMAKMLVCTLSTYQTEFSSAFEDVPETQWYYPYVASAHAVGVIKGRSETRFDPAAEISRQDMAVMAYRGLKLMGIQLRVERDEPSFTDADQIADYAQEAVTALYQAGLLNGMGDKFAPRATTTRAQAAQLIYGVYTQVRNLL